MFFFKKGWKIGWSVCFCWKKQKQPLIGKRPSGSYHLPGNFPALSEYNSTLKKMGFDFGYGTQKSIRVLKIFQVRTRNFGIYKKLSEKEEGIRNDDAYPSLF